MTGNAFGLPNYGKAKREAKKLLEQFDVTTAPVNPIRIAEEMGVAVRHVTFTGDSRNISGFFDCRDNSIIVNEEEYGPRQTFTIAHELGHKVLHEEWAKSEDYTVLWRDLDRQHQDFREKEANAFAAALLMPKFLLDEYVEWVAKPRLATLFAVSLPAMNNRLSSLYGI